MRITLASILLLVTPVVLAVDTPSTLLISGTVVASGSVSPSRNNTVIVLRQDTQEVVKSGKLLSDGGLFAITIRKTSAFDGTPVTLQFEKGGRRYQLYETAGPSDGGTPADFDYSGGLVPRRVTVTLYVGEPVGTALVDTGGGFDGGGLGSGDGGLVADSGGGLSGAAGASPEPPPNSTFDVNDDGIVDQLDVDAVKRVVAGDPPDDTIVARADVNNDEIVNTRDLIAVIKAVRRAERERRSEDARRSVQRP
jgi:hypothetical protein